MISKEQYISSISKELDIISHLVEKLTEKDLSYKPTEGQRTVQELLEYMAYVFGATVEIIKTEDKTVYGPAHEKIKGITLSEYSLQLQKEAEKIKDIVMGMTEEDFTEEFDYYGSQPKAVHLLSVLKWATSYKMQLFLYMKNLGYSRLGTMNVWVGMDPQ